MILPLNVLFPYSLLYVIPFIYSYHTNCGHSVTLGWTWSPGEPQHYARQQWAGMGIMLGVNLLSMRSFRISTGDSSLTPSSQALQ